jgi:hypothetical protein
LAVELTIGTCFGFAIRSSLPFHYLRSGDGLALTVSASSHIPGDGELGELLAEWTPTPQAPFAGRLYRQATRLLLQIGHAEWFVIDTEEPSITVPEAADVVRREERLWNLPVTLCFLARGDLPLHAAAVEVEGQALVFGAPRTHGKTTLAAAFVNAGYRLLSEDVTCLRIASDILAIPGPAMLRVRPDVAERLEIKNVTRLDESDDRVHFALEETTRGDGNPIPVRAVVLLRESEDGFRLEPLPSAETLRDLWPLTFGLPGEHNRARTFAGLVDLARSVPISNFYRPRRIEDLPRTVEYLVDRH